MLNNLLMINFYSYFQKYWNEKYTVTSSNAAIGIAQTSLVYLTGRIDSDDTTVNQTLLRNEAESQSAYIEAFQGNKAGIITDIELAAQLVAFKAAKTARRIVLPGVAAYINSMKQTTQTAMSVEQTELKSWEDSLKTAIFRGLTNDIPMCEAGIADSKINILDIQEAIDVIDEFETNINAYIDAMENDLDLIETTGQAPVSYQDLIDASQYTYDGLTYSDDVNHISPEGNLYGQTTTVQVVEHLYWWTGSEWEAIPDAIDQAASVDLLPSGEDFGVIFRIPKVNATGDGYIYDYYYSTGSAWVLMNEYWAVESITDLPSPGYRIGDYHKVIERSVTVKWDGYQWNRLRLGEFEDNIGLIDGIAGLTTNQTTLQDSHNELLESYLGSTSTGNTLLDAIAVEKAGMLEALNSVSSDLVLSEFESQSLEASFDLLTIGYNNIVAAAGDCDPVVSTTSITAAYDALHTEFDTNWFGQTYPLTLASGARAAVQLLLQDYEEHRFLTQTEINESQSTGISTATINDFRLSIYNGFIKGFTPDLELVYVNKNELTLRPKETGNYDLKEVLKKTAVFTYSPILDYTSNGGVITLAQSEIIESNNEVGNPPPYSVYLANQHDDFETSIYDYRGKLFLSNHTHSNNYWVDDDGDFEAILVGTVSTIPETIDGITKIIFEQGINTSLVSQESDVKETFREYSDFDLEYTDETTLTLSRIYGTRGQMYVPESLYYLGESRTVSNTDWIINVSGVDGTLALGTEGAAASTLYYVYIGTDSDIYNFNTLAGTTPDRPLHPGEVGYVAGKDFRLSMFLSTTIPDNGRLAQTYYGYWARHIGQILTDSGGKFIYSGNVSAIRQATLNPTYLDGLAEVSIEAGSTTSFKVVKKRGTSGVVMVGARGVVTPAAGYTVTTSDKVYTYDEDNIAFDPTDPLVDTITILDSYIGIEKYLYLANDRPCWGSLAGATFLCDVNHTAGYLSQNYPGNNARWIATIKLAVGTKGTDLVTNGNFPSGTTGWTATNWTYSGANLNVAHNTGNTSSLDQSSMTVVANSIYEVAVTVTAVGAGSVTPKIGNTLGTVITSEQRSVQYIKATNTDVLKLVPTSTFNGAVDTVTAFKIEHGAFSGNYITDSITKDVPTIDNYDIGTNILWDSVKIMQVINDALGASGLTSVWNAQTTGGLNLRLEYVNTTTVRLIPSSGTDSYVVFPDKLSFATIPAAGITMTVAGSANTRYYVYLSIGTGSGALSMSSANAPNGLHTKLETYGTANIQVGDICMTSTNTMSGAWNVCSSHQETSKEWSTAITGTPTTLNLPGLVASKRTTSFVVSRSGQTDFYAYVVLYQEGLSKRTDGICYTGQQTCTCNYGLGCTAVCNVYLTGGTRSEGVNTDYPMYSDTCTGSYSTPYGNYVAAISARSGNLILTRS